MYAIDDGDGNLVQAGIQRENLLAAICDAASGRFSDEAEALSVYYTHTDPEEVRPVVIRLASHPAAGTLDEHTAGKAGFHIYRAVDSDGGLAPGLTPRYAEDIDGAAEEAIDLLP